jgi:hypothetical protein
MRQRIIALFENDSNTGPPSTDAMMRDLDSVSLTYSVHALWVYTSVDRRICLKYTIILNADNVACTKELCRPIKWPSSICHSACSIFIRQELECPAIFNARSLSWGTSYRTLDNTQLLLTTHFFYNQSCQWGALPIDASHFWFVLKHSIARFQTWEKSRQRQPFMHWSLKFSTSTSGLSLRISTAKILTTCEELWMRLCSS